MIIEQIDTGYAAICNCYLIVDEETGIGAVIDPGAYDSRSNADEIIQKAGVEKLEYILLTHGHFDHILGVKGMRDKYDAKVVIHEDDAICLTDVGKSLAQDNGLAHIQQSVHTDVLVDDGDEIKLGSSGLKVLHTPGHTPGSVCYVSETDNVIFSGDTLFCMTVGRTDFEGGSTEQLVESLKKLTALEGEYRVLPGHNRETSLDRERTHNRFIRRM